MSTLTPADRPTSLGLLSLLGKIRKDKTLSRKKQVALASLGVSSDLVDRDLAHRYCISN